MSAHEALRGRLRRIVSASNLDPHPDTSLGLRVDEVRALLDEYDEQARRLTEHERTRTLGGPVDGTRVPRDTWQNEAPPPLDVRADGSTERTT